MTTVSIILCTYNQPVYLRRAIESVLKQSYQDWELIIVNDDSPHLETKIVISDFTDMRVKYIENSGNLGNVKSANAAITKATGRYIARIDDDDEWLDPAKLERQVAFLEEHADYALVGTNIIVGDFDTGKELYRTQYPTTDAGIKNFFSKANPFAHSSVLVRRDAMLSAGGYDERLRRIEDYDLWMKLGKQWKLVNLAEPMVLWRAPSRVKKDVGAVRFYDHLVKLRVLWRHRSVYPHFWPNYLVQIVKLFPYALLALIWR